MPLIEQDARTALQRLLTDYRKLPQADRASMSETSVGRQFIDRLLREVLDWTMGARHNAAQTIAALDIAIRRERLLPSLIVHSDRYSEFANACFHQRAADAQLRLSMSSTDNCYDNASAESFYATVILEAIRG